jgi:predicted GIY-YIG superfamily endonuclease
MITVTIQAVFNDTLPDCSGHYLYRFYDGDTTLYIGKSMQIEDRIASHLGIGSRMPKNRILSLVNANQPDSLLWMIDLYTVKDCETALHENLDELGWNVEKLFLPHFIEIGVQMAEESLIRHYRPCLNVLNNSKPSELPAKYRTVREE